MRTMGTISRASRAISHQSQRASKLARNTTDAPTGHLGRRRRRATSRRAALAKSRQPTTSLALRIAKTKVTIQKMMSALKEGEVGQCNLFPGMNSTDRLREMWTRGSKIPKSFADITYAWSLGAANPSGEGPNSWDAQSI